MATDHRKVSEQLAQEILLEDPNFLREVVERVLQGMLESEMTEHIGAAPYERSEKRTGHRNGYKPRALAVEQSEEWITGRRYLDMGELEGHCPEEE